MDAFFLRHKGIALALLYLGTPFSAFVLGDIFRDALTIPPRSVEWSVMFTAVFGVIVGLLYGTAIIGVVLPLFKNEGETERGFIHSMFMAVVVALAFLNPLLSAWERAPWAAILGFPALVIGIPVMARIARLVVTRIEQHIAKPTLAAKRAGD